MFGDTGDPALPSTVNVADGAQITFAQRGFNLGHSNILPGTLAGVIYQGNTATQEFSVARDGTFTFTAIGDPVSEATGESSVDLTTGVVTLEFDVPPTASLELRDLSYEFCAFLLMLMGWPSCQMVILVHTHSTKMLTVVQTHTLLIREMLDCG